MTTTWRIKFNDTSEIVTPTLPPNNPTAPITSNSSRRLIDHSGGAPLEYVSGRETFSGSSSVRKQSGIGGRVHCDSGHLRSKWAHLEHAHIVWLEVSYRYVSHKTGRYQTLRSKTPSSPRSTWPGKNRLKSSRSCTAIDQIIASRNKYVYLTDQTLPFMAPESKCHVSESSED